MEPKAVYSDFGFTVRAPERNSIGKTLEQIGVDKGEAMKRVDLVFKQYEGKKAELFNFNMEELEGALFQDLGPEERKRAVQIFRAEDVKSYVPVEGVEIFRDFLSNGVRTGIISQSKYPERIVRWLDLYGLDNSFIDIYTSAGRVDQSRTLVEKWEAYKSDGSLQAKLKQGLAKHSIDAEDTVIVGDNPELDGVRSKEQGFKAIIHNNIEGRQVDEGLVDGVTDDLREVPRLIAEISD